MPDVRCRTAGVRRPLWRRSLRYAVYLAWVGTLAPVYAEEPLDLIPADSLLCWNARPYPDAPPPTDEPSTLATLVDLGTRLAGQPLDARARIGLRLAETFGLMVRYPHALALIDAQASPTESGTGRRVDQLRLVMVVQTGGQSTPFRRMIQKTVNELTDSGMASLSEREAHGRRFQELRDKRLPAWCVIGWGELNGTFVLTLGEDVWPRIAAIAAGEQAALSGDEWMRTVRAAHRDDALIEIHVAIAAIRARLDPFLDGRASDFFAAWEATHAERVHWALGFVGPAMFCESYARVGAQTRTRVWADPRNDDPRLRSTILDGRRYAIYRIPVAELLPRFVSGLVATRSPDDRKMIAELWERLQRENGFDAQAGFLDHLGGHIVLHNDPPHPLRLPLAFTTLIEIRAEPARVRQTLDAMCSAWQRHLERQSELAAVPDVITLQHDADGVWYLRFGPIAGIAWTATDRFLVASWSPSALRDYLGRVGAAAGRAPAGH